MGFSISPQSRFVMFTRFWISIASNTLLVQYLGSCFNTLASSQSTLCCCSHACTATSFFMSPLLTAALCSTNLFCKFLPISPVYTFSRSLHGTVYTMPFFSICDLGVLTFITVSRRVPLDLNTTFSPICLQTHCTCICSDVRCT